MQARALPWDTYILPVELYKKHGMSFRQTMLLARLIVNTSFIHNYGNGPPFLWIGQIDDKLNVMYIALYIA